MGQSTGDIHLASWGDRYVAARRPHRLAEEGHALGDVYWKIVGSTGDSQLSFDGSEYADVTFFRPTSEPGSLQSKKLVWLILVNPLSISVPTSPPANME